MGRGQARLMEKGETERRAGHREMAGVGCKRGGDYKFTMGKWQWEEAGGDKNG